MNIPLRIVESPPAAYGPLIDNGTLQPGDMWRDDFGGEAGWAIILPNRRAWHTWQTATGDGLRWDVSGDAPCLTVSPSIFDRSPGQEWHGWIRNGELVGA